MALPTSSFPFLELPSDLQQRVYGRLTVDDRTRLRASLPSAVARRVSSKHHPAVEKRLCVMLKAIRKRRIPRLTGRMLEFLRTMCTRSDPTIAELQAAFPETAIVLPENDGVRKKSLSEQMTDGSLTRKELLSAPDDVVRDLQDSSDLATITPATFDVLLSDPRVSLDRMKCHSDTFVCCLFIHDNGALLDHLANTYPKVYTSGVEYTRAYVLKTKRMMYSTVKLLMHHIRFTHPELEILWQAAMDVLDVDAAEEIDEHVRRMQ